jgi:hypothetical protein
MMPSLICMGCGPLQRDCNVDDAVASDKALRFAATAGLNKKQACSTRYCKRRRRIPWAGGLPEIRFGSAPAEPD